MPHERCKMKSLPRTGHISAIQMFCIITTRDTRATSGSSSESGAEPANVLHVSYISQTEKFAERGKWYKGELNTGRDEPSQASSQVRQEIIEELRPCLGSRGEECYSEPV